jgi:hypothetical protein
VKDIYIYWEEWKSKAIMTDDKNEMENISCT